MPTHRAELNQVFQALADPTRRGVIDRLAAGATTTSALAEPFAMALPSFTQHLGVLERAGLVTSTKEGRVRTYRLASSGLDEAAGWLADRQRLWTQRLDQLDHFLISTNQRKEPGP